MEGTNYSAIINTLFEITGIILFIQSLAPLEKRRRRFWCVLLFAVVAILVGAVNIFQYNRMLLMLNYVVIVLFSSFYYRIWLRDGFLYTVIAIVAVSMIELIVYMPLNLLGRLGLSDAVITLTAVIITVCICVLFARKRIVSLLKQWLKMDRHRLYYLSVIASVMVIIAIIYFKERREMSLLEGFYLLAALGILFISVYRITFYQKELKLHKQYSTVYGEAIREIRERQHKFSDQLDAIYGLYNVYHNYDDLVQQQKEQLGQLRKYVMPAKILILESPLVVAHVYQKMYEAREAGIDMELDLRCGLQDLKIPEIYLIEVLGNLLGNAMDEILAREKGEKLYLSVYQIKSTVHIQVYNEHDRIPIETFKKFFERGYSSKGEGRGVGLHYVKKIVHQYGGELEVGNIKVEGKNCFSIKVSFEV